MSEVSRVVRDVLGFDALVVDLNDFRTWMLFEIFHKLLIPKSEPSVLVLQFADRSGVHHELNDQAYKEPRRQCSDDVNNS